MRAQKRYEFGQLKIQPGETVIHLSSQQRMTIAYAQAPEWVALLEFESRFMRQQLPGSFLIRGDVEMAYHNEEKKVK